MDNFNLDLEIFDEIGEGEEGGIVVNLPDDFDQAAQLVAENTEAGEIAKKAYWDKKWDQFKYNFNARNRYFQDNEDRQRFWKERKLKMQIKHSWKKRWEVWNSYGREDFHKNKIWFEGDKVIRTNHFGAITFRNESLVEIETQYWMKNFTEKKDGEYLYNQVLAEKESVIMSSTVRDHPGIPSFRTLKNCLEILYNSYWKCQYAMWQDFNTVYRVTRFRMNPTPDLSKYDEFDQMTFLAVTRKITYDRGGSLWFTKDVSSGIKAKEYEQEQRRKEQKDREYRKNREEERTKHIQKAHSFLKKLSYKSLFWDKAKLRDDMEGRLSWDYREEGSEETKYINKKWFLVWIGKDHKVMKHIDTGAIIRKDLDEVCTLGSKKYHRKIRLRDVNHNLISKRILL